VRFNLVSRAVLVSVTTTAAFVASAAGAQAGEPEADTTAVETVVVTAQKREQNLQDVPIAITALSSQRLEELGAVRLSDLSNRTPGLLIEKFNNIETVFIRGVGGGGRSIGFSSRAGIYIDGVYTGQPGGIDQALADAQRVEVLRGPQGTLFGRNTVSGAVNIVTRPPSGVFGAEASGRIGNLDERSGSVSIHGPLVADKLFGKLSVFGERRDGFVKNLFDGSHKGGQLNTVSGRGALRWVASDKLTVDFAADYTRDRSQVGPIESVSSATGAGLVDPLAPEVFQINENTPRVRDNRTYGASATATYQLPAGHTLTSITAWRGVRSYRQSDTDYSPLSLISSHYKDEFEQGSQELRIASANDGRLRYVAGVFFIDELAHTNRRVVIGPDATGRLPVAAGTVIPSIARIRTRSYAAFANADFDIVPQLTLNVGARYTHEDRSLVMNLDGSTSGVFAIATLANFRDSADEDHVTPTIGLTWRLGPDANVYAKYSEGFKSGGWNVDFLNRNAIVPIPGRAGAPFAFQTERAHSYEAGLKAEFLERRVRVNMAGFLASYGDYQINHYISNGSALVIQLDNAAKVDTSGLETSLEAQLTPNLRLTADATFLRTRFVSFPGGGVGGRDASGNRLPMAPRFTGAFGGQYTVPLELAGGRISLFYQYSFRGFSYASQENTLPGQAIPSFGLSTGRVSWRSADRRLEVALWGENLGNHRYIVNQGLDFLNTKLVQWGEPRTWGVEIKAQM
jgi:iron complex outermembrane receptor protein